MKKIIRFLLLVFRRRAAWMRVSWRWRCAAYRAEAKARKLEARIRELEAKSSFPQSGLLTKSTPPR